MNSKVWVIAALVVLLPAAALAGDSLRYSYVEPGWVSVEPDGGGPSGSGPAVGVSWGVSDLFHVVGQYSDVDFDPVSAQNMGIGAGVHGEITDTFHWVGEVSWVESEVDVPLVGSFSEDGYELCAGVRASITESFEINGGIAYTDLGPTDDTSFEVAGIWNVNQRFAVGAGYETGDNSDDLFLGFRIKFGSR